MPIPLCGELVFLKFFSERRSMTVANFHETKVLYYIFEVLSHFFKKKIF